MKIQILQPLHLHEQGTQKLNEDFLFPLTSTVNPTEKLFMVCDGEGGTKAGQPASQNVALSMARYLTTSAPTGPLDLPYLNKALKTSEETLTAYKEAHPESKAMATTIAMIHFGPTQVTMAWIGDCRAVYYNKKRGELTVAGPEEGIDDPMRITGADNHQSFQLKIIPNEEVGAGDYFFLMTNSLHQQVSFSTLEQLFRPGDNHSPEKILEEIQVLSKGFLEDNYSCYLIPVERVTLGETASPNGSVTSGATVGAGATTATPKADRRRLWTHIGVGTAFFTVLILLFSAWYFSGDRDYRFYMDQAEKHMAHKDYSEAIAMYDSAMAHAESSADKLKASGEQKQAIYYLDQEGKTQNLALDKSPETYRDEGDEFFRLKNYPEAFRSYQNALDAVKQEQGADSKVYLKALAEAYLKAGNELAVAEPPQHEQAVKYFDQGFRLFQSPEISDSKLAILDSAMLNQEKSLLALGKTKEEGNPAADPSLLAEGTTAPDSDKAAPEAESPANRSFEPIGEQPKEIASNDASSKAETPSTTGDGTNTRSNVRIAQPQENLTTRSLDEATQRDLLRRLTSGKNLFADARRTNSEYQYQRAAENLENAAPILDGAGAYMLAYLYHTGLAGEQNAAKALKYAQKSALQGWASGQYLYGHLLLERKYPRDTITARRSLNKAAEKGYLDAVNRLRELGY